MRNELRQFRKMQEEGRLPQRTQRARRNAGGMRASPSTRTVDLTPTILQFSDSDTRIYRVETGRSPLLPAFPSVSSANSVVVRIFPALFRDHWISLRIPWVSVPK